MEEEGGWEGGDGRGAVKRGEGAGGGEGGGGGDLPRTVCTPALLSHLSPSTISLWLAELIMEKCGGGGGGWKRDSGDPPPPSREDQISSPQVRGPEPPRICL